MKFHYRNHLIVLLILAFCLWISAADFRMFLKLDPLSSARSINTETTATLQDAEIRLDAGIAQTPGDVPLWLQEAKACLINVLVVLEDQDRLLGEVAQQRRGWYSASMRSSVATFLALVGTFSAIILSWRKDMRESRAELEQLKAQEQKILLP